MNFGGVEGRGGGYSLVEKSLCCHHPKRFAEKRYEAGKLRVDEQAREDQTHSFLLRDENTGLLVRPANVTKEENIIA